MSQTGANSAQLPHGANALSQMLSKQNNNSLRGLQMSFYSITRVTILPLTNNNILVNQIRSIKAIKLTRLC